MKYSRLLGGSDLVCSSSHRSAITLRTSISGSRISGSPLSTPLAGQAHART